VTVSFDAMRHAEALHYALCSPSVGWRDNIQACHAFIARGVPCTSETRPHDLPLQMFIEAADIEWHLDVDGRPSPQRSLFDAYLASNVIALDRPVNRLSARKANVDVCDAGSEMMLPLEVAMRRSSVAAVVALLDAGASSVSMSQPGDSMEPPDLVTYARTLPADHALCSAMATSVIAALLRRKLRLELPPLSATSAVGRRRMGV
jgi:hypothetical protein